MASRNFLVLIAIALVPFVMARQNPSDKEASQIDLPQKDGGNDSLGIDIDIPTLPALSPLANPPHCSEVGGAADSPDTLLISCTSPPAPTPDVPTLPSLDNPAPHCTEVDGSSADTSLIPCTPSPAPTPNPTPTPDTIPVLAPALAPTPAS